MADAMPAPWTIGYIRPAEVNFNHSCQYCGVRLLKGERAGFCCGTRGKHLRDVRPLPPLPPEFDTFINHPNISSSSRIFNLVFSFAALESKALFPQTIGPPGFFAIQGKIYHRVRPGHPDSAVHWLLHDGFIMEHAPHYDWAATIPLEWKNQLRTALTRVNPFARAFLQLRSVPQNIPNARLELVDSGATEIAALIRYDNTALGEVDPRRIVVSRTDGTLQWIDTISRLWEPLAYPLFFPHGTLGWGVVGTEGDIRRGQLAANILPDDADAATTQIWHYRARLLREPRFRIFGRLTNEYVVDMWTRELECRLQYIKKNIVRRQREDAELMGQDVAVMDETGNIYLPQSFLGSRAWASKNVADSLAVAAAKGAPTFFVTMTTNVDWPEIRNNLLPGHDWTDDPVLVARVFKQKLACLMTALKTMFTAAGSPHYIIESIEFQKRGLPHAHLLIKYGTDCLTAEDIDAVVSAEMPSNPVDAALVTRLMMHHHPAANRPAAKYCQNENLATGVRTCRFDYPHKLQQMTTIDNQGRVHYRRRNPGDEMVVPHCLPLLQKLDCHINFEVANSSELFQYLFKYIHKGPDRARYELIPGAARPPVNEVAQFWDGRYLSAGEAVWRIMGYSISRKDPAVSALPIHLPGSRSHHQYHDRDGARSTLSKLDRYFHRPSGTYIHDGIEQAFRDLSYTEYYQRFRLEKLGLALQHNGYLETNIPPGETPMAVIQRNIARPHITRIDTVRPSAGERFYLRTILAARPALSFEDVRTVDGITHETFQGAALAMGLFDQVNEAHYALDEAILTLRTPHEIRLLFIHLLTNECIISPIQTWGLYQEAFCRDFSLAHNDNLEIAEELALRELARHLEEYGKTLEEYGLPQPNITAPEVLHERMLWGSHRDELRQRVETAKASFNPEQQAIFDTVDQAITDRQPLRLFIDGKAGRGKTYLVNTICDHVRSLGKIAIPTATSAHAARLYRGGRTTHSAFKVPVNEFSEMLVSSVQVGSARAELLREAEAFIWDEGPTANRAVLACIDALLRQLGNPDLPFGGKIIIILGDFRQTGPVVRNGTRAEVVNASIRMSPLFETFTVCRLITPIRNAGDPDYADFVDEIGDGAGPEVDLSPFLNIVRTPDELINWVYPQHVMDEPVACMTRSILAPTNLQIDDYNNRMLHRLDGGSRSYLAADSLKEADEADVEGEQGILDYVARKTPPGLPPHSLTLKAGAIVRLLRNFSIDRGLVKNVRGVVYDVGNRLITIRLLLTINGINQLDEENILIPRITFSEQLSSGHTLLRRQFPLALAYATTFNSCQGLTLDRVGVDLVRPVFSHGQLYTALSRIRHRTHGIVRLPGEDTATANITYDEILL